MMTSGGIGGALTSANGSGYKIEVDEIKFFKILHSVIQPISTEPSEVSLDWLLSVDLYEILDSSLSELGGLGFREFCIYVYLLSASLDGML